MAADPLASIAAAQCKMPVTPLTHRVQGSRDFIRVLFGLIEVLVNKKGIEGLRLPISLQGSRVSPTQNPKRWTL